MHLAQPGDSVCLPLTLSFQTLPAVDALSANPYVVADDIIADFSGSGSDPGSLRGIALDELTNKIYVTDHGE